LHTALQWMHKPMGVILNSNINIDNNVDYVINYIDLLNKIQEVRDNVEIMPIKIVIN